MRKFIIILAILASNTLCAEPLVVGKPLPKVTLSKEDDSGKLNGEPWNSDSLRGKVFSVFYVDPDERRSNEALEAAYKKEDLPIAEHQGVAIINLGATWLPNSLIEPTLKKKQEEFSHALYLKDANKILVKKTWNFADDSVNVMVVDKLGIVRYLSKKPVPESEFSALFALIRSLIAK